MKGRHVEPQRLFRCIPLSFYPESIGVLRLLAGLLTYTLQFRLPFKIAKVTKD